MFQLSSEFLIGAAGSGVMALIGFVSWLIRIESKLNNNTTKIEEVECDGKNRQTDGAKYTQERLNEVIVTGNSRNADIIRMFERNDAKIEKIELRAEQNSSEVRTILMAIQRSLFLLEGKLSINGKNDER